MSKPYSPVRTRGSRYLIRQHGNLIHNDVDQLLKKESDNTLSEDDIKKIRLLVAREPKINKENSNK